MVRTAYSLHASAIEYANRGRLTSAHRLLVLAAARTSDVDLRARIDGTLALVRARTGFVAEGEALCAAAIGTPGISTGTAAILAGQMGSILETAGQLDRATTWLSRAIDAVDDDLVRAHLLMNRATIAMQRRRLSDAGADTERAASTYADRGRDIDAAEARHNLGYIAMLRGDLVEAMRRMSEARVVFATASAVSAAVGDVDRAEVLRDAGLDTEAERILDHATRVFGRHRMPQARAEAELALARARLTHDPAAAARTAAEAARRFHAVGNETWAARADGIRVRAALARGVRDRGGAPVRAARAPAPHETEEVARSLDRVGLREDARAVRLAAQLHAATTGTAPARTVRVGRATPIDVRLLAREVRVARADAAGREHDLRRQAAAGLDELGRWQQSFGSLDLQAAVALHGVPLLRAGLASAVRSQSAATVFEWAERARQASQRTVPLRPPPDDNASGELAELRMLRAEADAADWLASDRAAHLADRARDRQWSDTGAAGLESRIGLDALVGSLGSDVAVASYVFTGDEMLCVLATSRGADLIRLPDWARASPALRGLRADLDMAATVRSGPLARQIRASLDARLAIVSDALIAPVTARAHEPALVVTAPGVLAGVPWSMLPALRGRMFVLAASATRWAAQRAAGRALERIGFAAGPRVPRAVEEVAAAASAWHDASVLTAQEATVDAVTALAGCVDVLHVAAHGRHAVDNPMFSGLDLHDGALFGYDVDRMPHVPDTVVLSACEVGRSTVRGGEEAIGMTRVWLHAGSRCVIAAPVIVADDVAGELLAAMHARLAAGSAPAVALAEASERTGHVTPFQAYGSGI